MEAPQTVFGAPRAREPRRARKERVAANPPVPAPESAAPAAPVPATAFPVPAAPAAPMPAAADDAPGDAEPAARPRTRGGRASLVTFTAIAVVAAIVAAGAFGAVAGWSVANRTVVSGEAVGTTKVVAVDVPAYAADVVALMPDVRGLDEDRALQTIADAGIPVDAVSVTTRPAAGGSGRVVEQTPVFGSTNPSAVQIIVSEAATVPAYEGRDAVDVLADLEALGTRVTQERRYVPGVDPGAVAELSAKPGTELPDAVTLVIADSPSTVALADLLLDYDGWWDTEDDVLIGDQPLDDALECGVDESGAIYEFTLGGAIDVVEGMYGIQSYEEGGTVTVTVFLDGAKVDTWKVTRGKATAFSLDTADADELTLVVKGAYDGPDAVTLVGAAGSGSVDAVSALRAGL
ncbi:PASTA domain-containing protein [Demequina gelatinilytica]|uniref:PASTA domain-containing protein n=1 Tax=Demequina gelatinilytica TaxID=1638980 RepID=UPI000781C400|nr:PASTA domain-containing protein [Demequina gelatinilytica]